MTKLCLASACCNHVIDCNTERKWCRQRNCHDPDNGPDYQSMSVILMSAIIRYD